jgi:hypothetical protein
MRPFEDFLDGTNVKTAAIDRNLAKGLLDQAMRRLAESKALAGAIIQKLKAKISGGLSQ